MGNCRFGERRLEDWYAFCGCWLLPADPWWDRSREADVLAAAVGVVVAVAWVGAGRSAVAVVVLLVRRWWALLSSSVAR